MGTDSNPGAFVSLKPVTHRRFILLIAIALIAAACGSGESSATLESLENGSGGTMPPSSTTTAPADQTGTSGETTTTTPADQPAPAELPESEYPDVVVADLAGGDFYLKELALEQEPVLLWFWAPH